MKKLKKNLIKIILIMSMFTIMETPASPLRVIDADTIAIPAPYLPKPLKPELLLRIIGIDSPEKGSKAKCEKEKLLEITAENFLINLLKNPNHEIQLISWDKYGGRVLGDIFFPLENTKLSTIMVEKGFAKPYDGLKKESWCN